MRAAVLAFGLILVACARPEPATVAADTATSANGIDAPTAPRREDAWLGRWVGVEGMVLDIAKANVPGRYRLTMQWDLDHRGEFTGVATSGPGIAFERQGVRETLRPTDGAATGLKYLAGKRDCLTVRSGEGYCRS